MGRPVTPAALKVLHGTFDASRNTAGPAVELKAPDCPAWLPRSAKKYWKEISGELERVGLIGIVDTAAFAIHCDSLGKYAEVCRKLKTIDDMMTETPQGFEVQAALFQIRNKLWDQVYRSSREFGLTPAGRSVIKPTKKPDKKKSGGWDDI